MKTNVLSRTVSGRSPMLLARRTAGCRMGSRCRTFTMRAKKQENIGNDWYEETRNPMGKRTVREELEYRKAANLKANNGKERKDLYTDNWDGSEWKGNNFNILTLVIGLFVLVPILGLYFAYATYGELWG